MTQQLEAGLAAIDEACGPDNAIIAAKCRGLLRGYHARWKDAGYRALSVDRLVTADLFNPDTKTRSRSFSLAGLLDVVAEIDRRAVLVDHKTTSHDIADPNGPYWRQLVIEGQASHYMLLEWLNARKLDTAMWDVVRKPQTSPKKLTKAERANVVADGRYFNARVSNEERQQLAAGDERETPAMYEARLAHDCTTERPEWFFQRRYVPRLDSELLEYAAEIWQHSKDILYTSKQYMPPRNSGACMLYGSPCTYLGICSGHDTPDSDKWQRRRQVHRELPGLEGDGRNVLTNSRIRCFQTCRRKHYYQYDLGIERIEEEEREALFFGTAWHAGLRAWWNCLLVPEKERENVHCYPDSPVNGIGQSTAAGQELPW